MKTAAVIKDAISAVTTAAKRFHFDFVCLTTWVQSVHPIIRISPFSEAY